MLGVIGIRSGSKGVRDKNVRIVNGHPLVAWILQEAHRTASVDRVVVSTDSEVYAEIARHYGAEVPCLRPAELAGDDVPDHPVVRHMLDWLEANDGYSPEIVLRLLATVPLQLAEDIDGVVDVLRQRPELSSAMAVAEARQHPAKALRLVPDPQGGRLVSYMTGQASDVEPRMRQSHEPAYFRANIVASRVEAVKRHASLAGEAIGVHVVPQERGLDVDTETDLEIVDLLMARHQRSIVGVEPYGHPRRS